MPPGIFCNFPEICPKPTKPLGTNGFPFDRLMTPTFILSPTKLWPQLITAQRFRRFVHFRK